MVWPVTWRANAAGGPAGHDGSHDVRAFQRAVIQREIRCVESLVMRQAILETDIKRTSMGHPRLGRHRTRGRIDAVAAAILAVGAATAMSPGRTASDYILHELYEAPHPERRTPR